MIGQAWAAFPAGMCIATIVMVVGFGGGILWMPFLLIVLHLPTDTAIITSLLIQTAGTGSGSVAYTLQKKTDNRLALLMMSIAIPGVIVGAYFAHRVVPSNIEVIIGAISLATALLFASSNEKFSETGVERVELKRAAGHSWIAVVMAVASGMLTLNIAEWLIPVMRNKMGLRMSNAVATCIVLTCGECFLGVWTHYFMGAKPDWAVALWGIPGVIIGGQIGPRLAKGIDERLLKEIFIFMLTLIGVHLVYKYFPM